MSAEKVTTFRERFNELVSSCGKSQTSIASEFGVAKQTISAWITGQSSPRAPVLSALAEYFDVSLAWLMGYDVPKRENKELYRGYEKYLQRYLALNDEERHVLDLYNGAEDTAKQIALETLQNHQKQEPPVKKAT